MIVEFLHVERAVDVELAVVRHGVAHRCSVLKVGAPNPLVRRVEVGIGGHPVEDGDKVERHFVGE